MAGQDCGIPPGRCGSDAARMMPQGGLAGQGGKVIPILMITIWCAVALLGAVMVAFGAGWIYCSIIALAVAEIWDWWREW